MKKFIWGMIIGALITVVTLQNFNTPLKKIVIDDPTLGTVVISINDFINYEDWSKLNPNKEIKRYVNKSWNNIVYGTGESQSTNKFFSTAKEWIADLFD
jgi:hypothetical protein